MRDNPQDLVVADFNKYLSNIQNYTTEINITRQNNEKLFILATRIMFSRYKQHHRAVN